MSHQARAPGIRLIPRGVICELRSPNTVDKTINSPFRSASIEFTCIFYLNLSGRPKIGIAPENHYVLSGATVSFYCVGYGDPQPELTWTKNGESVKESDRVKIDKSRRELRITAADFKDAGTYECTYSNKHGEDKKSAVLNVDGQAGVGRWFISVVG